MEASRLEIVQRIFDAWARGDFTAGPEHFRPDIHFESFMPDSAERVVTTGREGIVGFMSEFLPTRRNYRLIAERFHEIDERTLLVEGYQDATGRYSGAAGRFGTCSVWTFDGDRVVSLVWERDREAALRAAGAG